MTTKTLTEAKTVAARRADAIEEELAALEAERAQVKVDELLGRDGAGKRLAALSEKIGALIQERADLTLAAAEIGRRQEKEAERAKPHERERLTAERDRLVEQRNGLYDEVAAAIERMAFISAKCALLDVDLNKLANALGEAMEPTHRGSAPRIVSYISLKMAEAGFTRDFNYPHPSRRVKPRDW